MRSSRPAALAAFALVSLVAGPFATAADSEPTRGLRFPALTPDGKTVVFSWRGDIWKAPTAGGTATRLTIHEAQDTKPKISPDGRQIAFSSRRTGTYDVFVMPIDGGEPRQVTFHSSHEIATDWSPDGTRLLFLSGRDPGSYGIDLYEVAVAGGTPRRITRDGGRDGSYSPDGKRIVYSRGFHTLFQDGYKGSAAYDLYVIDAEGGTPTRLTSTPVSEMSPCFSADGKTVWYLAESKGAYNVGAVPAAGGEAKTLTSWTDDSARRATLAWDRRTLAFEKDGRLLTLDLENPTVAPKALAIRVESDVRNSGTDVRTVTSGAEHVSVSPDGARIAVALRGDLWVLSSGGGDATRVTSGPATDDWPRWSPDGRRLVYFSDASGNDDICVVDVATKAVRPLTTNTADDAFPAWFPDGKHVVFASSRAGNKDLWMFDLETGEERQLTRDGKDDDDPVVSPDGQWIAFDSGRSGNQSIWVMPVAGGEARARKVSSGTGFYQVPSFSPDGTMVAFEEMDPAAGASGGIWVVKTTGGPSIQVSKDGNAATWSPGGDWIYFHAARDGATDVYRVRAPKQIEAGEKVPFLGRVTVDRRREFGDLFDEAWEKLKNGFYDPNMHGVDWNAMKAKYRPIAVDCEIKEEFYNVVSQMLGELKASHLGIYPGGADDEGEAPGAAPTGYLGLELDAATLEGGGRRIAAIQARGPADEAGLRVGDVVKSVAGTVLKADTDLDRVLAGAAGKDVALVYGKNDGSGDRTSTLKAMGGGALGALRYALWTDKAKKTVGEKGKGDLAYIHLAGMMPPDLAKFNAQLAEINQRGKAKGLVLDVRNNGGGNIHQQVLQALASKPYIAFQPRGFPRQMQPQLHWGKPIVVLINERSFSDAEVFPYAFKELKLGKVVGVPTAGGVIGTTDIDLSDGSKFRIARVGWYGLNGDNLERIGGVKPDVVVEETTEDRLAGRDPQLDQAIELVLAEIRPPAPKPEEKPTPKPEEKPVAKPEEKPVAKPTEKPADKPVETPAPKPVPEEPRPAPKPPEVTAPKDAPKDAPKPVETGKPVDSAQPRDAATPVEPTKPVEASTPAAVAKSPDAGGVRNPLADAQVGEWVKVRMQGRGGAQTLLVTVTNVTDTEIEVETTPEGGGTPARKLETKSDELDLGGQTREAADRRETLTIAGKRLECVVVTLRTRRGELEERWYSNDVPVRGMVRRKVGDRVVSEVLEWGTSPRR